MGDKSTAAAATISRLRHRSLRPHGAESLNSKKLREAHWFQWYYYISVLLHQHQPYPVNIHIILGHVQKKSQPSTGPERQNLWSGSIMLGHEIHCCCSLLCCCPLATPDLECKGNKTTFPVRLLSGSTASSSCLKPFPCWVFVSSNPSLSIYLPSSDSPL